MKPTKKNIRRPKKRERPSLPDPAAPPAFTVQLDKINLFGSLLGTQWRSFTDALVAQTQLTIEDYMNHWQNYLTQQQKWLQHDNSSNDFFKQAHEFFTEQSYAWVDTLAEHIDDPHVRVKLKFLTKQMIEAVNPNNFMQTNPEILKTFLQKQGENIADSFKYFLSDMELNKTLLNLPSSDRDHFKVGNNIAVTPGKIIYQNELIQLIHYTPSTATVYQKPLLIVPPWINKYYILDLQAENSFVKWIVDQGHSVFLISWINPTAAHAHFTFADYVEHGPLTAIKVARNIAHSEKINVLGYCVGGTLLACALAYLAKQSHAWINSATFLTTLLDFSEPGELGAFIDKEQLALIDQHMQKYGYLSGDLMAAVFNLLRPQELIWTTYINRYLKGQKPLSLDFLSWNADFTNLAANVHSFYLREMYLHNALAKANQLSLFDTPLDLSQITLPSYCLATQKDHITLWTACYRSIQLLGGEKKFVLANSGHVAGVINPPVKNKYGYYTHADLTVDATDWLSHATLNSGSWWTHWEKWLCNLAGEKIPAPTVGSHADYPPLEDAPGSYVRSVA